MSPPTSFTMSCWEGATQSKRADKIATASQSNAPSAISSNVMLARANAGHSYLCEQSPFEQKIRSIDKRTDSEAVYEAHSVCVGLLLLNYCHL